jgi:hypothetical protein
MKVSTAGGTPTTLAAGHITPHIAVDTTSIYWTTDPDFTGSADAVMKAPLAGGDATTVASGQGWLRDIAVNAEHVCWLNARDGTVSCLATCKTDSCR